MHVPASLSQRLTQLSFGAHSEDDGVAAAMKELNEVHQRQLHEARHGFPWTELFDQREELERAVEERDRAAEDREQFWQLYVDERKFRADAEAAGVALRQAVTTLHRQLVVVNIQAAQAETSRMEALTELDKWRVNDREPMLNENAALRMDMEQAQNQATFYKLAHQRAMAAVAAQERELADLRQAVEMRDEYIMDLSGGRVLAPGSPRDIHIDITLPQATKDKLKRARAPAVAAESDIVVELSEAPEPDTPIKHYRPSVRCSKCLDFDSVTNLFCWDKLNGIYMHAHGTCDAI